MDRKRSRRRAAGRRGRRAKALLCVCGLLLVGGLFLKGQSVATPDDIEPPPRQDEDRGTSSAPPQWNLLLVNAHHPLPQDFSVELAQLRNGHHIDERAYPDLCDMIEAARVAGLDPVICSSYRSNERQKTLYETQVDKYIAQGYEPSLAREEAGKWIAVPGTSEHQTGLAVDIVAGSYQLLDQRQESTAEQVWLMENAWRYGFVLRYPKDKSAITGIHYEPWHYRYVGKNAAREMHESGLCLEEYLDKASG